MIRSNATQHMLVLEPPYRTRLVQHLHHVEVEFARGDNTIIINWLQEKIEELKALPIEPLITEIQQSVPKVITAEFIKCKDCTTGQIIDTSRTNEVFPQGIPILCPTCKGTTKVELIPIQSEDYTIPSPPNTPNDIIDPELGVIIQRPKVVRE